MTISGRTGGPHIPSIPWPGLLEVLSAYSGKGQLYDAVAAGTGNDSWTAADVRRRARRVLFAQVLPLVARWPVRLSDWWDALPRQVRTTRALSPAPAGRVDWARTRAQGWPPTSGFWAGSRRRIDDDALVGVLAWTITRLDEVRQDAARLVPGIDEAVSGQLKAAQAVLVGLPATAAEDRPDRAAQAAVRLAGRPWGLLAEVATVLVSEDHDLAEVARRLLLPDEAARGRLFHLACLGLALEAAKSAGCLVAGLRPLGVGDGPAYRVTTPAGEAWDLWFEGAGMWTHYGSTSPYVRATSHMPGVSQPIGADLVLTRPGVHALVVECKYSADPGYITRNGYEQALAYQAEALTGLVDSARAVVVGPDDVIHAQGTSRTQLGPVHLLPAGDLPAAVRSTLAGLRCWT